MRRLSVFLGIISLIPLAASAYSVSCSGIPDAGSCQQCFHFTLASNNSPSDIFVPRSNIPSGQQEYIDLSQSTVTGQTYQGVTVTPTGNIMANFDTLASGPNATASWVWAKSKSGKSVVRGNVPAGINYDNPVYSIKYKTVSHLKDTAGSVVPGSEVTHLECGFFYVDKPQIACGNGIVETGEQCDDGNKDENDSCSNTCQNIAPKCSVQVLPASGPAPLKTSISCTGTPQGRSAIVISRNNSIIDASEAATKEFIFSEAGEYSVRCYPNAENKDNTCVTTVHPGSMCGNGKVEAGEQCDDGNTISGDGCQSDCRLPVAGPVCGNGKVEAGEQCDDGNKDNGDICTNLCQKNMPNTGNGTFLFMLLAAFVASAGVMYYLQKKESIK